MADTDTTNSSLLPALDDMLHTLLLREEDKYKLTSQDEDVKELRHLLFPVTRHNIYLKHSSLGPLSSPVAHILHDYANDASNFGDIHDKRWKEHIHTAHSRLAKLISARPDQGVFTASTADGLMLIAHCLDWQAGDTIIIAEDEFPSNVHPWLNLQELGVQVHTVPAHNHRIVAEDIFASITSRTRLVSLSLVEFSTGFRNDIAPIAAYCHERGILCGIDAIQALGALDVNVQALNVDYVAAAAHKWLLSPRTTGILYVSDNLFPQLSMRRKGWYSMEEPFDYFNYQQPLKAGAACLEYSWPNGFPIVGLDVALEVFESLDGGMQAVEARVLGITRHLLAGLKQLGYPIISPQGEGECSGIVCFLPHPEYRNMANQQIASELAAQQIYVVARAGAVRISPHFYNTIEEIDMVLNTLEDLKK
jgi:selenocysteine lyase/cysteine desulfurase